MRKVIVGARVSMDGVMEEPMGPSEEFKLGGWARAYQDQDCWDEFQVIGTSSCRSAWKPAVAGFIKRDLLPHDPASAHPANASPPLAPPGA